ncbi:alpha/beta fold hydrolase [Flavobacterium beibuense]|uniref:Putative hydrolase or acyltransferase of alpha/beta superfamily n=1 Tax=Flavobacterium beibuense TaxID=657326 RepID=A0A444W963_9FLAO|nr:alpha/beta hydrolase [Flavobacterium beibuense]RYJ42404.1 putative hydrolase or acyltransferase of alpha/beta superfamily [Flavobacterium beibuense]
MKANLISIQGNNLNYHYKNNYPGRHTLVFLHDSLGCVELWRDFPDKLAELTQCNVLVYDRLGYGKSDAMPDVPRPITYMEPQADALHDLLAALNISSPILFGHSDGGTIALLTAAKYPETITAVIAEAAHIFVEEITLNGIRAAAQAYKNTNLKQRLEKYHGANTDILFRAWTQTWTRHDFKDWNITGFLPAITCPLLVIQGTDDEFGSLEQVNGIVNNVSGRVEKQLLPATGHTPHKETPEETLRLSAAFIEKLF